MEFLLCLNKTAEKRSNLYGHRSMGPERTSRDPQWVPLLRGKGVWVFCHSCQMFAQGFPVPGHQTANPG